MHICIVCNDINSVENTRLCKKCLLTIFLKTSCIKSHISLSKMGRFRIQTSISKKVIKVSKREQNWIEKYNRVRQFIILKNRLPTECDRERKMYGWMKYHGTDKKVKDLFLLVDHPV